MKFDLVIGNPPYQLEAEDGESNNTKVLYDKFVYTSKKFADEILFVLPSNYLCGNKGPLKKFRKFIKSNGLVEISEDKSDHFDVDTAGISVLHLKGNKKDTFIYDGVEIKNDFTDSKIVVDQKASELYYKLCSLGPKLNCNRGNLKVHKTKTNLYSKIETDKFTVPMFINCKGGEPIVVYVESDVKKNVTINHFALTTQDWNKDELTFNNLWHRDDKLFQSNDNFIHFVLKEDETFESFQSYVNTKVFKFLLKYSDTGSRALPIGSLKKFPTVSFDREWTDEALYDHFNLSVEDIDQLSDLP